MKATFGIKSGKAGARKAVARAVGVKLELMPSGTKARIGYGYSRIDGDATGGAMSGAAWGSKATTLGGTVNSGRTAYRPLPCVGTRGQFIQNEVAEVAIPGVARLGSVVSKVRGDQGDGTAWANGISTIKRAELGDKGLVVTGIRGQGFVKRRADDSYARNSKGTTVGSITLNGETQALPARGETLEIPDVALIRTHLVTKRPNGIKVTAVRVRLLKGRDIESTIDLGNVRLKVRRG